MTAFLHAMIDIVFFSAMIFLFSKRLDDLEEDYDELKEEYDELKKWAIDIEAKEIVENYEVNYLMEQAEKQPKSG